MLTLAAEVQWMPCVSSCALLHSEITVDNYQIQLSWMPRTMMSWWGAFTDAVSFFTLLNDRDKTSSSLSSSQELSEEPVGLPSFIAPLTWAVRRQPTLESAQPVYTHNAVDLRLSEGESRVRFVSSRPSPWFLSVLINISPWSRKKLNPWQVIC